MSTDTAPAPGLHTAIQIGAIGGMLVHGIIGLFMGAVVMVLGSPAGTKACGRVSQ